MNRLRKSVIFWIAGLLLGYFGYLYAYPTLCLLKLKLSPKNKGPNHFYHQGKLTPQMRDVILPNPDFFYSICGYDLSEGDVEFSFKPPKGEFWSVSFYDHLTNVFWSLNETDSLELETLKVTLTLDSKKPSSPDEVIIESPFSQGAILLRFLNKEEGDIGLAQQAQNSATCSPKSTD